MCICVGPVDDTASLQETRKYTEYSAVLSQRKERLHLTGGVGDLHRQALYTRTTFFWNIVENGLDPSDIERRASLGSDKGGTDVRPGKAPWK